MLRTIMKAQHLETNHEINFDRPYGGSGKAGYVIAVSKQINYGCGHITNFWGGNPEKS